jgi:hypothetical protein
VSLMTRVVSPFSLRSVALVLHRLRMLGLSAALVAAMTAGLGLMNTVPAAASSGGGCEDTYAGFGEVSACISVSGSSVLPDGYVTWDTIPPNCSIGLFLQNANHQNVSRGNYSCGQHHYGPLSLREPSGTTWYSVMIVYSGWGDVDADSPPEHLSY